MTEYPVEDKIDKLFSNKPETLKKIKENRNFISKVKNYEVKSDKAEVPVFVGKSVNINAILKNNIYNHTAFTIDKICRLHRNMTYEQLKKYQSKKRSVPMRMIWLLIILFGVATVIIVILLIIVPLMGG